MKQFVDDSHGVVPACQIFGIALIPGAGTFGAVQCATEAIPAFVERIRDLGKDDIPVVATAGTGKGQNIFFKYVLRTVQSSHILNGVAGTLNGDILPRYILTNRNREGRAVHGNNELAVRLAALVAKHRNRVVPNANDFHWGLSFRWGLADSPPKDGSYRQNLWLFFVVGVQNLAVEHYFVDIAGVQVIDAESFHGSLCLLSAIEVPVT